MSPLLLYALVRADEASAATAAAGGGLASVSEGSLAVLYGERVEPPSGSRDDLIAFGKVLSDICSSGPALPVRYGTVADDLTQVRDLVRQREARWRQRLDVVAGHVELVVHAHDDGAPSPSPVARGRGREYLVSRVEARRHAERLFDDLLATVGVHCCETRRLTASEEVRIACLVAGADVDEFKDLVATWVESVDGRHATTTGPWPPFSFTEAEAADDPGR